MQNRFLKLMMVVFSLALMSGCATTSVKRVDVNETVDLSGRWNDTDSRMVSGEMITDAMSRPWVERFRIKNSREPRVIIGPVANQSHEHINSDVFTKDLELAFLNSGLVKVVASRDERGALRDERLAQNNEGFTDPETIKKIGKELGADLMLIGSINSVKDEVKSRYVILYQVNLELIDLETNEKMWIGQQYHKKIVQKSKYSL